MKIAIVAPACPLDPAITDAVTALAKDRFAKDTPQLIFHPQCYLSEGHFAGPDQARADALVEVANDPTFDAVWFARGGYGSNRIALDVLDRLTPAAHKKAYLGYSDMGFLLAGLSKRGIGTVAHGPMASDMKRDGGDAAVARALNWLVRRDPASIEPTQAKAPRMAFNLTVLATLLATPLEPNFEGVELLLEDVDEHHYRLDRTLFGILANPTVQRAQGVRLGRCTPIPENDRPFGQEEEQIAQHWCTRFGITYLGRADIGHDVGNKVVPFG